MFLLISSPAEPFIKRHTPPLSEAGSRGEFSGRDKAYGILKSSRIMKEPGLPIPSADPRAADADSVLLTVSIKHHAASVFVAVKRGKERLCRRKMKREK
jgi:hypothetical protein